MYAEISVFVICLEAIVYLLLFNFHDGAKSISGVVLKLVKMKKQDKKV